MPLVFLMAQSKATKVTPPAPDPPSNTSKKNAKWSSVDNDILLGKLLQAKRGGEMAENGFKKKTYIAAVKKLEKMHKLGGAKTESNCKTRQKMVCHSTPLPMT